MGVGARDEQEDVGVVDALEQPLHARLPVEAVIQGGVAEQQQRRGHEYGAGSLRGGPVGDRDQNDAPHDGQRERRRVDPAAPGGLDLGRIVDQRDVGQVGRRIAVDGSLCVSLEGVLRVARAHAPQRTGRRLRAAGSFAAKNG
jgi:hypothetical protein